jgi:hypothetical protein
MMGKTKWFAAAALAAGTVLASTAAQAVTASVFVNVAPPAPRYEVAPAGLHGHVWVPGHWQWNGTAHVWVGGHHVRERSGYSWSQPQWHRNGGGWAYTPGGWVQAQYGYQQPHYGYQGQYRYQDRGRSYGRDRDRDGIPDRRDRDLDNDGRPNHRDRDMDGDGVPNRYDRDPDNRYRR